MKIARLVEQQNYKKLKKFNVPKDCQLACCHDRANILIRASKTSTFYFF